MRGGDRGVVFYRAVTFGGAIVAHKKNPRQGAGALGGCTNVWVALGFASRIRR